jgi:hypothetical protein
MDQPVTPEAKSDIDTAKTLTLVAMVFQVIFLAIGILLFMFLLAVTVMTVGPSPYMQPIDRVSTFQEQQLQMVAFVPLLIFMGFGILPLIFLLLTYFLVYVRLREGRVEKALAPALILGILNVILGGLISGILLIIAYVKAKDAHTKILMASSQAAP